LIIFRSTAFVVVFTLVAALFLIAPLFAIEKSDSAYSYIYLEPVDRSSYAESIATDISVAAREDVSLFQRATNIDRKIRFDIWVILSVPNETVKSDADLDWVLRVDPAVTEMGYDRDGDGEIDVWETLESDSVPLTLTARPVTALDDIDVTNPTRTTVHVGATIRQSTAGASRSGFEGVWSEGRALGWNPTTEDIGEGPLTIPTVGDKGWDEVDWTALTEEDVEQGKDNPIQVKTYICPACNPLAVYGDASPFARQSWVDERDTTEGGLIPWDTAWYPFSWLMPIHTLIWQAAAVAVVLWVAERTWRKRKRRS
jgi:hypothetical protein